MKDNYYCSKVLELSSGCDIILNCYLGRSVTGAPHKCGICAKTFESIDVLKVRYTSTIVLIKFYVVDL